MILLMTVPVMKPHAHFLLSFTPVTDKGIGNCFIGSAHSRVLTPDIFGIRVESCAMPGGIARVEGRELRDGWPDSGFCCMEGVGLPRPRVRHGPRVWWRCLRGVL